MQKAFVTLVFTGIGLLIGFWFYPQTSAEQAFDDFLTVETKESYLVMPLCKAGKTVVPLVAEKIKDKDLEKRTYAISFLGSGDYKEALPTLEMIAKDESEIKGYRANSLESIYLIDESKGKSLAEKYKQRNDYLGEVSREILKKKNYKKFKKETQYEICHPTD